MPDSQRRAFEREAPKKITVKRGATHWQVWGDANLLFNFPFDIAETNEAAERIGTYFEKVRRGAFSTGRMQGRSDVKTAIKRLLAIR